MLKKILKFYAKKKLYFLKMIITSQLHKNANICQNTKYSKPTYLIVVSTINLSYYKMYTGIVFATT